MNLGKFRYSSIMLPVKDERADFPALYIHIYGSGYRVASDDKLRISPLASLCIAGAKIRHKRTGAEKGPQFGC